MFCDCVSLSVFSSRSTYTRHKDARTHNIMKQGISSQKYTVTRHTWSPDILSYVHKQDNVTELLSLAQIARLINLGKVWLHHVFFYFYRCCFSLYSYGTRAY